MLEFLPRYARPIYEPMPDATGLITVTQDDDGYLLHLE